MDAEITIHDQRLQLLAERALYAPGLRTMVVADTDWGHEASLDPTATSVSVMIQQTALERLDRALSRTRAEHLIVLGNFLHAVENHHPTTDALVRHWRSRHEALAVTVCLDSIGAATHSIPDDWNIAVSTGPMMVAPFVFQHRPAAQASAYAVCGQMHPKYFVESGAPADPHRRMALPCFWFRADHCVLPAFSAFIGGTPVRPGPGERVLVVSGDNVMEASEL